MMRSFLCHIAVICLFSSCITLKEPEVRKIDNLNADGLFSGHPKINFDLVVYNPNSISLSMTDFAVNIAYRNRSLATIKTNETYFADALAEAVIPLSIEPTMEQLNTIMQSGLAGLSSGDLAGFSGTGSLKVKKFFLSRTFNFRF
jgi:hypothetical protein